MFKIESYVTPIILSYVDKYVKDFRPGDAQLSLWSGGVVLHNLVLKTDVLQKEVSLPFTLKSGRIHELTIRVPWTKIMSEPITVTIDTIECILSLLPDEELSSVSKSGQAQVVETPPGYMQALIRRIVSNIAIRVKHLIVKYVQDDVVLSLNVKYLSIDSTGSDWKPAFADIDYANPEVRRQIILDDLTLCLDRADSDGKIRFYQDPLLYRCRLDFRVLTNLVSSNSRKAKNIHTELRSQRLAWGVTSDQIILLLRLWNERPLEAAKNTTTAKDKTAQKANASAASSPDEPTKQGSWTEWAWSWMPTLIDRDPGTDEILAAPQPIPMLTSVYIDEISLIVKAMEVDYAARKRSRNILEIYALHSAIKMTQCYPTLFQMKIGIRDLYMQSRGTCVCGHSDFNNCTHEPTIYLRRKGSDEVQGETQWDWPKENVTEEETVEASQSQSKDVSAGSLTTVLEAKGTASDGKILEFPTSRRDFENRTNELKSLEDLDLVNVSIADMKDEDNSLLWKHMAPIVFIKYLKERFPPDPTANPYDNPPKSFEFSDWVEDCVIDIQVKPIDLQVCMGLIHRLQLFTKAYAEAPKVNIEQTPRTLTIEECEALHDNIPQKRLNILLNDLNLIIPPWDHSPTEKPEQWPVVLHVTVPKVNFMVAAPLYAYRVCSAASQVPLDKGPLWHGARVHFTACLQSLQAFITREETNQLKPIARVDLRFVSHTLLYPDYFDKKRSVVYSYAIKINELNISGSSAVLQIALEVLTSLQKRCLAHRLTHTTLIGDAFSEAALDSVALDISVEEWLQRGFITKLTVTHQLTVKSFRTTVFHSTKSQSEQDMVKQAWVVSGPDAPTSTPLIRFAVQLCHEKCPQALNFFGIWVEPLAIALDPLFIAWFSYKPRRTKATAYSITSLGQVPSMSSSLYLQKYIRATPQKASPSGERIHTRSRSSFDSPSEPSEKLTSQKPQQKVDDKTVWFDGPYLLKLHDHLKKMMIAVEVGLVLVYFTTKTASAVDFPSIRLAMEAHAAEDEEVFVLSLGRWTMYSSSIKRHLWHTMNHDGPTYMRKEDMGAESFPWTLALADISCYTIEPVFSPGPLLRAHGVPLRSQLKVTQSINPRTVLQLVTTTVTLSIVTKRQTTKIIKKTKPSKAAKAKTEIETKINYYQEGTSDFRPTTLKEFFRGPPKKGQVDVEHRLQPKPAKAPTPQPAKPEVITETIIKKDAPVVSVGLQIHADTPPIKFRIEHDQVQIMAAVIHCCEHLVAIIKEHPLLQRKHTNLYGKSSSKLKLNKSDIDQFEKKDNNSEESESSSSSSQSSGDDFKVIYEEPLGKSGEITAFLLFQWVISRATIVVSTDTLKFVFDMDDIITTVDVQQYYNQLKMQVVAASIKQYERDDYEWKAGPLGGRVVELSERTTDKDPHFISIVITKASIANLPRRWKEELHPKTLEQNQGSFIWEFFVTLAPLEVLILPNMINNVITVASAISPNSYCSLPRGSMSWNGVDLPYIYVDAGSVTLLAATELDDEREDQDDAFILSIGKISANPHPENPIIRRLAAENYSSRTAGHVEGRQYEVMIKNISVKSASFSSLIAEEERTRMMKRLGRENPAHKWGQKVEEVKYTPVVHPVDINAVFAPVYFVDELLVYGNALEISVMTDCTIELALSQLLAAHAFQDRIRTALKSEYAMYSAGVTQDVCPYAPYLHRKYKQSERDESLTNNFKMLRREDNISKPRMAPVRTEATFTVLTGDSGVGTANSSTLRSSDNKISEQSLKKLPKSASSMLVEQRRLESSQHYELIVTMGTIELSLYATGEETDDIRALIPKEVAADTSKISTVTKEDSKIKARSQTSLGSWNEKSMTETIREAGIITDYREMLARANKDSVPLIHMTMIQPNLYYWRRKAKSSLQISIFDLWLGFGIGPIQGFWHLPVLTTARGNPDPLTDIPPALVTFKCVTEYLNTNGGTMTNAAPRRNVEIDIERPVMLEVSSETLYRLIGIHELMKTKFEKVSAPVEDQPIPKLYKLRELLSFYSLDSITVQTNQVALNGSVGGIGCESTSMQLAYTARPDKIVFRSLTDSLIVVIGANLENRLSLLQPVRFGTCMEATWDKWCRNEGGSAAKEPIIRMNVDLSRVYFIIRPVFMTAFTKLCNTTADLLEKVNKAALTAFPSTDSMYDRLEEVDLGPVQTELHGRASITSNDTTFYDDLFYQDDLRSGAFKILTGNQLPMPYQILLDRSEVSWSYPHPRAITKIVVFPLPDQNKQVDTVLEFYNHILHQWEPHTYILLPTLNPIEINLRWDPPEVVFATMWRYRVAAKREKNVFRGFDLKRFMPKENPTEEEAKSDLKRPKGEISAEKLLGILRVDSFMAPRLTPRTEISIRTMAFTLKIHNDYPDYDSTDTSLEGYYLSENMRKAHQVLTLIAFNSIVHARIGASGYLFVYEGLMASGIMESSTGAMEPLVDSFEVQAGLSVPNGVLAQSRFRLCSTSVHVALHVPRFRTLESLMEDWRNAIDEHGPHIICQKFSRKSCKHEGRLKLRPIIKNMEDRLEGRIFFWIHNTCATSLRVGQKNTDEVILLAPGCKYAYRWRSPSAPKKLQFAIAETTSEWCWSHGVPFTEGENRVRLENKSLHITNDFLFVHVLRINTHRHMDISGRIELANMLRFDILYKVRVLSVDNNVWNTLATGELAGETIGHSVISPNNLDMVLKIKLSKHNTGWSGDIPLRECPKENVPWLVKVPTEGETPYTSVWCRIVRARVDNRVFATFWPLYILHSHLTLDTDVLIETDMCQNLPDKPNPPPLIQTAPGRGACIHLLAPGTTSAKHSLLFQYRNIECPVTRDAVPLHYGVTDTSVFEKHPPINKIVEVTRQIEKWLVHSGQDAESDWPYSVVTKHWEKPWQPALMQPRCEVTVRYEAVRAAGGCSLKLHLSPVILLCNASPINLTLRAHDAAPLCKLEPGHVISPPTIILDKPFFVSIEMERDTFVSTQLEIFSKDPGRYGSPPSGQVAIDHPATFAIQCKQKVALLNLYYEVKNEINILGLSSSFVFLNKLRQKILISATAVPASAKKKVLITPKFFKMILPHPSYSVHGTPICRFWLRDRWRGGDASELLTFISLALPDGDLPANDPVPIRLGVSSSRQAIGLLDCNRKSKPVVVTQHLFDGQWVISVANDTCPQFLVRNLTNRTIAIGRPSQDSIESNTVSVVQDCPGALWQCTLKPKDMIHYSLPGECAQDPPSPEKPLPPAFITFAVVSADKNQPLKWIQPVVAEDSEQLIHLQDNLPVKLRINTNPHSTYIELQNIDENDLCASNIRKRLAEGQNEDDDAISSRFSTAAQEISRTMANDDVFRYEYRTELEKYRPTQAPSRVSFLVNDETRFITDSETDILEKNRKSEDRTDQLKSGFRKRPFNYSDDYLRPITASGKNDVVETVVTVIKHRKNSRLNTADCYSDDGGEWEHNLDVEVEKVRCTVAGVSLEIASAVDVKPLLAAHLNRLALFISQSTRSTKVSSSVGNFQIDNLQYESGQFDFAVIATTCPHGPRTQEMEEWPTLWTMFDDYEIFSIQQEASRLLVKIGCNKWTVHSTKFTEMSELEIKGGPIALYIEDAYVKALYELFQIMKPRRQATDDSFKLAEIRAAERPLRLKILNIHPVELTLTLHTAVHMYIALDQSPLHLSAFRLQNMFTSPERLIHALTVHYLSAAMLGAGWVVGGLELLGAPGALAARVGGASGGVKGIASATAAALVRSLSAWAGSLARNLDLLGGDEEHARRAAAARRRPPDNLIGGLLAGITNFAINMLGAVGGLAHHPLVGPAVGETSGSGAGLRRGILGALTKPLSATADLVAYAGNGLLKQTGWDPVPEPYPLTIMHSLPAGWQRDSVRWAFLLQDLNAGVGFEVLHNNTTLQLLITQRYLVVAELETERIIETIDFRHCKLGKYEGTNVELIVSQPSKNLDIRFADEDEYQVNAEAMDRVARYTGAEAKGTAESRLLSFLPVPGQSQGLHTSLVVAINRNSSSHFSLT